MQQMKKALNYSLLKYIMAKQAMQFINTCILLSYKDDNSKLQMKVHAIIIDNEPQIILEIHNISLEEQIQRLIYLDQFKDSLLATVAHDMRNPLNSVLYLIDESLQTSNQIEINKNLTFSKVNGCLLMNLVNDILDYCQSKQNKLRLNITQFDLNNLIQETYQMIEISAKLQKVALHLRNLLPKNFLATSDRRRIQQVLINLIGNSVKFTPKGIVRLNVYQPPGSNLINFEILDEGSGIQKEVQDQIGQPFMTFGSSTNQNSAGIGLGLNVCKIIISLLGPHDSFFVSSKIGKGAKFSFQLYQDVQQKNIDDINLELENSNDIFSEFSSVNIRLDECSEQLQIQNPQQNMNTYIESSENNKQKRLSIQTPQKNIKAFMQSSEDNIVCFEMNPAQQNCKILIVDDDGFSSLIMKKQLLKISEKFVIIEASNGLEAVNYFKEFNKPKEENIIYNIDKELNGNIQLIIMDSQMPIMGGFEACNQIKMLIKEGNYEEVAIIGCTGLLTDVERLKAKNVGMEDILQKPCNLNVIKETIQKFI